MHTRTKLIGVLAGFLVACLAIAGILLSIASGHRREAQAFLDDFTALKLGESSFSDAQRLARQFRGIPWYVASDDMSCTPLRCSFAFKFENTPLSYVPFVHHTELFVVISVKDGLIVGRQLEYERNTRRDYYFRYLVFDTAQPSTEHGWSPGTLRLKVDPRGIPHVLQVNLGPLSTAVERKAAYALDLSCLARLHGCGIPPAFYPPGIPYLASRSGRNREPRG
jgi:hypothetical protein